MRRMGDQLSHVLGIDVGGTKISAGIVQFPEGRVIAYRVIPTRAGGKVLDDVVFLAENLVEDPKAKVSGLGIAICELVSPEGKIQSAATLKWSSQQVRRKLARFGPVTIEADVRAAALAEAMFGAGRKYKSFLFVTVGTGISCALVIDGKPYLGTRGATGTMASAALTQRCDRCGHVWDSSLEDIASGHGLVRRFNRRQGKATSAQDVFESASQAARQILEEGGEALGNTVALLVDVMDPQAVIVGGGIGLTNGIYWKSFITSTRRHIWSDVSRDVPIRHAATGQFAGVIGAAASTLH
jgi:glucokinase